MHLTKSPIPLETFLAGGDAGSGAAALFVGLVRNEHGGRAVSALRYECYEAMAEKEIARIIEEAGRAHGVSDIRVLHRIGLLEVGEAAVAIAVYSAHREEAFAACRRVLEEIKAAVPIWKHELYADGAAEWVCCRGEAR
ncbi:MAG: molybdenum cofactor biosynthesis protein MoaE [Candidatus Omnitrophica bacterium]|nr:molybdenum cofactor biosynthesis protein MoaE [Candidatus Omnitrophota bacterium]